LKIQTLIDSGYTHTGIDKQLVKNKKIQTKPINFSFEVYDTDGIKNREVTRIAPLVVKVNGHKERLKAAVTDLNSMNMFLEHDWLVKHNPEVNWKDSKIKFTRYPGSCRMKHQDIEFKTQRTQAKETSDISKKPDPMNLEDLLDYIQPFTYLFNKKKFEKLLKRREWDHKINLMDEASKELNTKAYIMIIKKEKTLN